jgi:hypothetical protein
MRSLHTGERNHRPEAEGIKATLNQLGLTRDDLEE